MAGLAPQAIVLALGAGALGGPEALRLLLQVAGRAPAADLAICVAVISVATAGLLGTVLLARFVLKAGAGGGAPRAPDLFAQATAAVSVGAALLVTASLVVLPGSSVRLPVVDFAVSVKNPIVAVLVICAAAGSLPCAAAPLLRFFRRAGGGAGPAPAATIKAVFLVVMSLVASGGFDAQLLFPGFDWRRPVTDMPVGVAVVTVAGTTLLLVWCSRRRRAGNAGGAAAPTS